MDASQDKLSQTFREIQTVYARSQGLEKALREAQRELGIVKAELENARDRQVEAEYNGRKQLEEMKGREGKWLGRIRALEEQHRARGAQLEELTKRLAQGQEAVRAQEERIRTEATSERSLRQELASQLEKTRLERDRLERDLQSDQLRSSKVEQELTKTRSEFAVSSSRVQELQNEMIASVMQSKESSKRISALEQQLNKTKHENFKVKTAWAQAYAHAQRQLTTIQELQGQIKRLKEVHPLRHLIDEKEEQLRKMQSVLTDAPATHPARDKAMEVFNLIQGQRGQLEHALREAEQGLMRTEEREAPAPIRLDPPSPPSAQGETETPPPFQSVEPAQTPRRSQAPAPKAAPVLPRRPAFLTKSTAESPLNDWIPEELPHAAIHTTSSDN